MAASAPSPARLPEPHRGWPVRRYLLAIALALALPVTIFVGIVLWEYASTERARLEQQALGTARGIALAVDRELASLISTLEVLSLSAALQSGDLRTFHARAVATERRTGMAIELRDLSGRRLLDSSRPWGEPLPARPRPVLDAEVLRTKRPVVSGYFPDPGASGAPRFGVQGPVLLGADQEVAYLIGISLGAERILEVIEERRPPPDWTVGVTDGNGIVLARAPHHAEFVGKPANPDYVSRTVGEEGQWRGRTLDGLSVLSSYRRTELGGWVVGAGVQDRVLRAPLRRSLAILVAIGVALAGTSALLALALGRRVARPLEALARGAEALGRGEPVPPVPSLLREAARIGKALAAASAGLREREASLRRSEERFRLATEAYQGGVYDLDPRTGQVQRTSGYEAITGVSVEAADPTGAWWRERIHPEDRGWARYAIARAVEGRADRYELEYRVAHESGRWIHVWDRAIVVRDASGRPVRVVGSVADVSAWREAEAALRESEEHLRLIVEGARDYAILTTDPQGRVTSWSAGAQTVFGHAPGEIVGQPVALLFTPEDRAEGVDAREIETARGAGSAANERWHLRKDGSRVFMSGSLRPLHDALGTERGFLKVARDETGRHHAERRQAFLLELSDGLRDLATPEEIVLAVAAALGRHLGVSRVGYGEVDPSQVFVTVERDWTDGTVASIAGQYRMGDFGPALLAELKRGRTVRISDVASDERTADPAAFAAFAALEARAAMIVPLHKRGRLTARLFVHNREPRAWVDAEAGLAREVAERTWFALERARAEAAVRRLNEGLEAQVAERTRELVAEMGRREEAESQLRQVQKMEAVGQLTGGIAHDFNNLLQAVVGSLDLLRRRVDDRDERACRYVDNAMEGARRAATLTQRLLAFSRQQALSPESLDANRLVTGMSDLLRRTLVEDIRLETVLAGGLWRVHADPNQLESAILNLAVNARDAMPGGGRITVETANAHLDEAYASRHPELAPGQYVMVAVSDTGTGMPAAVAARAFDPFFTTKPVGQGTGLGLSQVYGFAKQSGGHSKIYSEVGQGTTVKLYLPRHLGTPGVADAALAEAGPARTGPARGRGETVLVVEDDEAVRRFSVEALRELGYRVLEADGAAVALRLLAAYPEVALLFTDVVMPEVSGRRLADDAVRLRPGLQVLFTTGYSRNAVVHNGVLDPGVHLLGKPFTLEQLAARVRDILSGATAEGADEAA